MKIIVNKNEFDGFIESGTSVIQFSASWCNPCKTLQVTLENISKVFPGINFGKFNVEHDATIAMKYSVRSVPTTIFFKNGEEVERTVGNQPVQKLMEIIKAVF